MSLLSYLATGTHVDVDGQVFHPDLPEDFPEVRPSTYGECQAAGLGTRYPCPFATCRHSLLSDEYRGEMHAGEVDPWQVETCSFAAAARGRHSTMQIVAITTLCETTVEEWVRNASNKVKEGVGLKDFVWPPRRHRFRAEGADDRPLRRVASVRPAPPAARALSRAEVVALYGAKMVSPRYGKA